MRSVKFGLCDEIDFNTNSAIVSAFYPINDHEYLATTRNGLFRFESDTIKKIYPYKLATSIIIPEYQFVVGISFVGGEISVMMIDELDNPVFAHFKTDQLNIFHMIYSHKSRSLITVGSGIKVWNFNVKMPRKVTLINKPEITITLRTEVAPEYDTPILNPPSIDYDQELICLPTANGFCGYDFNGKEKKYFSKIEATTQTAASFCNENKKFLTAKQGDGFHLWSQKGYIIKRIPVGMSSILALRFINKHFAIYLDSNLWVFIIDIKTNNFYHCFTLNSKPSYFNVYRDSLTGRYYLIISQNCLVQKMEIVLPWTVWKKMTTQPYSIRRCPKFREAARILTYYKSSIFSFLSPKDGKNLTSAVDTQPSGPIFHYYDRGLLLEPIFDDTNSFIDHTNVIEISKENKRDVLFVTTAEANTSLFSTGNNPCQMVKLIEIQISSITVCEVNGIFMYCFSNSQGELLFYNYSDFSKVNRYLILKKPINNVFYHRKSDSILVVFQDEVHLFDLSTFKDIQKVKIKDGSYSEFYGNLLLIGCRNGNIESIRINLDKKTNCYRMIQLTDDCIHYHDDAITSFAFSPTFFISSSLDKSLKIWNYSFNLMFDIIFPFPLFSCEVLNAHRDLLVGTDNEILKIEGSSLFGFGNVDSEIADVDNNDQISDELTNQLIQFAVEKNKDEQSDFLSNRMKNKNDETQKVRTSKLPRRRLNYSSNVEDAASKETEDNQTQSKAQSNSTAELSEDERNRRLYEMNLINERLDNEKLQARLRAEMRMKKDEEERKRKLREAEEAKRKEQEENQMEEEEDAKEEGKGRKRKRRRKNKVQKVEIETENETSNDQHDDDIDDLLFKKKKQDAPEEEDEFKYRREKTVYQPKQSAPRPSRPFRTNTKQQNGENGNEYEEGDYDVDEDEESSEGNESALKSYKGKGKRENKSNKKQSNIPEKRGNKKKSNKDENNKQREDEMQIENDTNLPNTNSIDNDMLNENDVPSGDINKNNNEDEAFNGKSKVRESGSDNQKEAENKSKTNDQNNSQSSKPQKSEVDTQTSLPLKDEKSIKNGHKEDKSPKTITKKRIHQTIPREGILYEAAKSDDKESANHSHPNKKRPEKQQISGKLKSNSTDLSSTKQGNKCSNQNDATNSQTAKSKIKGNNSKSQKKAKTSLSKCRPKQEQIILTKNIKRSPTPPPKKVLNSSYASGNFISKSKTFDTSKSFLKFRSRLPLRRCRTPPVLQQEKLVILPGPEVVLDLEAIIDQILDGRVELMPILRRMNSNNRTIWIQRLKSRDDRKTDDEPNKALQFHSVEFNFQSSRNDKQKENNFGSSGDFSFSSRTKSNRNEGQFNSHKKSDTISTQFSYPPPNQNSARFAPIFPSQKNVNTNSTRINVYKQINSQKVENDEIILLGEDDPEQLAQNDCTPSYGMNALNRYNINKSNQQSEKLQKKRQKQVSILNLNFELQSSVRPLNRIQRKEIMIPKVQKPSGSIAHSPRRNFQYQKVLFGPTRSSSPPILYKPKPMVKNRNNLRLNRRYQ